MTWGQILDRVTQPEVILAIAATFTGFFTWRNNRELRGDRRERHPDWKQKERGPVHVLGFEVKRQPTFRHALTKRLDEQEQAIAAIPDAIEEAIRNHSQEVVHGV